MATASSDRDEFAALLDALIAQNQFVIHYDLDGVRAAAAALGLNAPARRVIIVGGTNGKGTTCAHLNAYGTAAGLRVGFYSSPHLVDVTERIRIAGVPVDRQTFVRHVGRVYHRFSRASANVRALSYFEILTLGAWSAFGASDLDLAVFEVGLGGRLDATNVLEPDLSIITSVALDHREFLGDTIPEIAREKSGILRAGRPCLLHRWSGGFDELEEAAQGVGALLEVVTKGADPNSWNRALAWRAFERVFPDRASESVREAGNDRVRWPGRQQAIRDGGRVVLLDGAHNLAALEASCAWLRERCVGPVPVIFGLSGKRSPAELLQPLQPVASTVVATECSSAPCVPAEEIQSAATSIGIESVAMSSVCDALAASEGTVAVVGSLYIVGEALRALGYSIDDLSVYSDSKRSANSR